MEAFEQEALELGTILDTMADGVFVISEDHIIVRWNQAMERITGYTSEEALGQSCAFLGCGAGAKSMQDCDPFARGAVDRMEMAIARKDGDSVPVLTSARVMPARTHAVVTFTDLSKVKALEQELQTLRDEADGRFEFEGIVGKSACMREIFQLIELAADSQASVLVAGETGTGKELVAKAIHYRGDRRDGPLVRVNCAALAESLLESELFGHVRGAFTGAMHDRAGRFEEADGGTLFLDEIGDISPVVQVKLLRVLQDHEFERVGESRPRGVDVRVIAATHRNLGALVAKGAFREDLFYRLKVFPIHLAPLRERKEDIDLLVRRFIEHFNVRTGKHIEGLNPDAMRIILDHAWPGNIRELENAIEHAFVTCPGGTIGPFDLPVEIRRVELAPTADITPVTTTPPRRGLPPSREQLMGLLAQYDWNKAEVARQLGVDRTTVWRRMKTLSIPLHPSV